MQIKIAFLLWNAASHSIPSTEQDAANDDAILTTQVTWGRCSVKRFELSPFVLAPQQERSRATLARIITGAAEVLIRSDGKSFSMDDIAKAAGVPVGSIYRRFKGKNSIVQAISFDTYTRIDEMIRDRMQGHNFASAEEVVAELAAGIAAFSEKNLPLIRLMVSHSTASDPALRDGILMARRRIIGYYTEAISGFLQHLPELRREIVAGISYEIVSSTMIGKVRGDVPVSLELSWSDLAQEVTKAATSYIREVV
jgi:AcrR family transcriptional regulator